MEPLGENREELIDDRGRHVTQRRIDEESGLDNPGEPADGDPDEGRLESADPEVAPS